MEWKPEWKLSYRSDTRVMGPIFGGQGGPQRSPLPRSCMNCYHTLGYLLSGCSTRRTAAFLSGDWEPREGRLFKTMGSI